MNKTIEVELKDYRGFHVTKYIDNKGTSVERTGYMATTQEDDPFDCDETLSSLKKKIDTYLSHTHWIRWIWEPDSKITENHGYWPIVI